PGRELRPSGHWCAKPDQLERECYISPREIACEAFVKQIEQPGGVLRQVRCRDRIPRVNGHRHQEPLLLSPVPHRAPSISHEAEARTGQRRETQPCTLFGQVERIDVRKCRVDDADATSDADGMQSSRVTAGPGLEPESLHETPDRGFTPRAE